jgi:multiple antibiotic resistance protein
MDMIMIDLSATDAGSVLPLSDVFVLLFVMLGPPMKTPVSYAGFTRDMTPPASRTLAWKTFAFALSAALIGGFVGVFLMDRWHVSREAMLLAGGILFFLVSLKAVLGQYEIHVPPPHNPDVPLSAFAVAVPAIVTPYGLGAIIILLAHSVTSQRTLWIVGLVVLIMLLHLLAMLYARPILRTIGHIPLQLFTVIAGLMSVGMSIQIILAAFRMLGALAPSA